MVALNKQEKMFSLDRMGLGVFKTHSLLHQDFELGSSKTSSQRVNSTYSSVLIRGHLAKEGHIAPPGIKATISKWPCPQPPVAVRAWARTEGQLAFKTRDQETGLSVGLLRMRPSVSSHPDAC